MKIDLPVDYIMGYLKYGHLEGVIELDPEAEKEFKELLKKDLNEEALTDEEQDKLQDYKESILDECKVVVDEYEIDGWGGVDWRDFLYEN